jgi:DNA-binding CsgD family transcriptional regulator
MQRRRSGRCLPANRTQVDVRPAGAFSREGAGHIPGVKSFPADRLIDPDGKFVTEKQLRQRLRDADIDIDRPVAAYCGWCRLLAVYARARTNRNPSMNTFVLPPLEKACLRWISQGRTLAEIAQLEGRSVTEIELCVESILKSIGARSIEDALAKVAGQDFSDR